jgi:hypothetical protein
MSRSKRNLGVESKSEGPKAAPREGSASIPGAGAVNRLARPPHGEFDFLRLQLSPALDLSLITVLRKAPETFRGLLSGVIEVPGEFLPDERVFDHVER